MVERQQNERKKKRMIVLPPCFDRREKHNRGKCQFTSVLLYSLSFFSLGQMEAKQTVLF